MSFDYAPIVATATELLKEYGQELILHNSTVAGGVYDPVTGETTIPPGGVAVDTPFNGVPLAIDEKYASAVGTQNIRARDQLVYMEPSVVEPKMEDQVVIDTEAWQIVRVTKIAPSGLPLLYILQVRP